MSLESATYISDLNTANPTGSDVKSQGDDHLRLIKSTLKTTFPNILGAVTLTQTQINQLFATRADVASVAGTVDLTANAPNTNDIRITGALAITAFTVAVGRVIRFTAGGAFSFANNASIVTQTGATITFASGDTGLLRATAANVVEVLALTRAAGIYFSAYQTTLTSAASGAYTKVALQAEEYDVGAAFDSTTNSRWTPGRIGLAHLNGSCYFSVNLPGLLVAIFKNGALYKAGAFLASGAGAIVSCDAQVTAITDYFELFVYHEQGGAQNTTPSQTGTYFQGHMVSMA